MLFAVKDYKRKFNYGLEDHILSPSPLLVLEVIFAQYLHQISWWCDVWTGSVVKLANDTNPSSFEAAGVDVDGGEGVAELLLVKTDGWCPLEQVRIDLINIELDLSISITPSIHALSDE